MIVEASDKDIRFHRLTDDYGCFTNFARYPIVFDGLVWPTTEHCFQAQKFRDPEYAERIRCAVSPSLAARLGRCREVALRDGWDRVRDLVMRSVVTAKFLQHPDLAGRLLATGDRQLVEDTPGEMHWGDGGGRGGLNVNGRILMDIRRQIRQSVESVGGPCDDIGQLGTGRAWVKFGNGVAVSPHRAPPRKLVTAALSVLRTMDPKVAWRPAEGGCEWWVAHSRDARSLVARAVGTDPNSLILAALRYPVISYVVGPSRNVAGR